MQPRQGMVRSTQAGMALGQALFSAVLVFGIFLEVLYLSAGFGPRIDVTQEKLYSLSDSTERVLDRLEDSLVIEAYFSQQVPGIYKIDRQKIVDLLDEYDKLGGDRVKVVYLDPNQDQAVKEKAERLGISEAQATDIKDDSIQAVRFWQGLRLRYGGDKQKVLSIVQNSLSLESELTPKIRELVLEKKPKVGMLVRPTAPTNQFMGQQQQQGFTYVEQQVRDRFDVVDVDLSKGQVLADDLDVLVVIQPKDLTDWEKYCIDQHVMRGGNLVVFQEAADYSIDQFNSFYRSPFQVDQPDSKLLWKQQLAAYGVEWSEKLAVDMLVVDMNQIAVPLLLVERSWSNPGMLSVSQGKIPYWFFARAWDWKQFAGNLASDAATVADLEKTLEEGIDAKHPILDGTQALSFFWPTEVGLLDPMPDGITGQVLVRTSPGGLTEDPPQSTDPKTGYANLRARINKEKRQQLGLMVLAQGKFASAWKGKDMPKRPLPEADKAGGLLAQDPPTPPQEPGKSEPAPATPPQEPAKSEPGQVPAAAPGQEAKPSEQAPETQGPPGPAGAGDAKADEKDKLPPRIDQSATDSRILVVGDASLIRDDFLTGLPPYRATRSIGGFELFQNVLDWMALDTDLVALRAKRAVARSLEFVKVNLDLNEPPEELKARIAARKKFWRWLNILLPVLLLLGCGGFVWSKRAAEKRAFLAGQQR